MIPPGYVLASVRYGGNNDSVLWAGSLLWHCLISPLDVSSFRKERRSLDYRFVHDGFPCLLYTLLRNCFHSMDQAWHTISWMAYWVGVLDHHHLVGYKKKGGGGGWLLLKKVFFAQASRASSPGVFDDTPKSIYREGWGFYRSSRKTFGWKLYINCS